MTWIILKNVKKILANYIVSIVLLGWRSSLTFGVFFWCITELNHSLQRQGCKIHEQCILSGAASVVLSASLPFITTLWVFQLPLSGPPFSSKALLLSIVPVFAALSEAFSSSGSKYPIYCTISQKPPCLLSEIAFHRNVVKYFLSEIDRKTNVFVFCHHITSSFFFLLLTSSTGFSCQNPYLLSFEKYFWRFVRGGRAELSPCLGGLFL